jgi:TolA-binding protein
MQSHEVIKLAFDNENMQARVFEVQKQMEEMQIDVEETQEKYKIALEEVNQVKIEYQNYMVTDKLSKAE